MKRNENVESCAQNESVSVGSANDWRDKYGDANKEAVIMDESQQTIDGYTFEAFHSLPRAERKAILHRLPSTARIKALNEYIHRFNVKTHELESHGYYSAGYNERLDACIITDSNGKIAGEIGHDLSVKWY